MNYIFKREKMLYINSQLLCLRELLWPSTDKILFHSIASRAYMKSLVMKPVILIYIL